MFFFLRPSSSFLFNIKKFLFDDINRDVVRAVDEKIWLVLKFDFWFFFFFIISRLLYLFYVKKKKKKNIHKKIILWIHYYYFYIYTKYRRKYLFLNINRFLQLFICYYSFYMYKWFGNFLFLSKMAISVKKKKIKIKKNDRFSH